MNPQDCPALSWGIKTASRYRVENSISYLVAISLQDTAIAGHGDCRTRRLQDMRLQNTPMTTLMLSPPPEPNPY